MVVQEAMRKYPAGGVASFRSPVKGAGDVVLGGGKVVIPQGAIIHTPIAAIQLLPTIWDEPERFNPDRWLQVCVLATSSTQNHAECGLDDKVQCSDSMMASGRLPRGRGAKGGSQLVPSLL